MEGGPLDEAHKIDVEKTYNQILAKRQAKLSRDALVERQATQLTKYFIRARQREVQDTIANQAEQSRKHYERNLQKTRDAGAAAAAVTQMVQEEKVIISTHMAEKGRERMAEELRAKSERQEREKWQQARVLYERFQAEERAKSRQEQEKLRIEKLQESEKKHHENFKSNNQEKAELLLQAQQKREHDAAKVLESKHKIWKENQKASDAEDTTGRSGVVLFDKLCQPKQKEETMQNDEGKIVDLYLPRKCSATNRLIPAKEHGAVQLNVAQVDENGQYSGETFTFALAGFIRQRGESDACLNRLLFEKGLLTFSK
ncbi:unnamed protein product [Effrenium voratum]|nr:unnamed protein product [Effrenium voratum]